MSLHQKMAATMAAIDRDAWFWSRVDRGSDCWLWTGAKVGFGYGVVWVPETKRLELAHRQAWKLTYGDITGEDFVLHRCDVPACVNPDHLFIGTQADNMADGARKGRVGWRKLSAEDVAALRREYAAGNIRQRDLAAKYGCTQANVSLIVRGESRRHDGAIA